MLFVALFSYGDNVNEMSEQKVIRHMEKIIETIQRFVQLS